MTVPQEIRDLIAQRSEGYGDPLISMECLATIWGALLQHHWQKPLPAPISPHVAALMLTSLKVLRASTSTYKEDSYNDACAFLSFAERIQQQQAHFSNGAPLGFTREGSLVPQG